MACRARAVDCLLHRPRDFSPFPRVPRFDDGARCLDRGQRRRLRLAVEGGERGPFAVPAGAVVELERYENVAGDLLRTPRDAERPTQRDVERRRF